MKSQMRNRALSQFMTPEWSAWELTARFLARHASSGYVLEPSCGTGMFLKAIPDHVDAVGVEIDPALAAEAEINSGRRVIIGDFRKVAIPDGVGLILGNPPYSTPLFDDFLSRAWSLLPDGAHCGFLVSTHMLQTPSVLVRWSERWDLEQELLPRTLFPRAQRPLVFLTMRRRRRSASRRPIMRGFLLYRECHEVAGLVTAARQLLVEGKPRESCWRSLVTWALERLGGKGRLADIYREVDRHRRAGAKWWREKVRQILQLYFRPVARGVWQLPNPSGSPSCRESVVAC